MIGRTVSHYKIVEKIGEGGMAVVYLARDLRLERDVALKFVRPEAVDRPDEAGKLLQEAQAAAKLDHPNICTIYEIAEDDSGQAFIAMAFVDGQNLKQKIRDRMLECDEAVGIAIQVAEGLRAAHQQGVVHRDIKSANIALSRSGHVKIMDFGLAQLAGAMDVTTNGAIAGTPSTMSPEQIRGETVDQRTDIWAFGVLLYEMLTGRLPFLDRNAASLAHAIIHSQPPSMRELNPGVSQRLDGIVRKAMAKTVADRYQDIDELLRDLRSDEEAECLEQTIELLHAPADPSVAVLAFTDMSVNRDQDYFCEGIADEIISSLSHVQGLRVASRTSSFAYKNKTVDIREIGRNLGVSTLLEGSVRKADDRLRITCQLVNVEDGCHLWSKRYDRDSRDIFSIQEEIAANVVQALELELSDTERKGLEKNPTHDVEAYDFYLRGRQFFFGSRRKSMEFALEMYAHATEKDPEFAAAYAGMADCYSYLFVFGGDATDLDRALECSQQALERNSGLAEAHASRGYALSLAKKMDEATREFDAAIALNPKLFDAYYFYARMCFSEGDLEKAAMLYEQACRVDPKNYQAPMLLALTYRGLGEMRKAIPLYAITLELVERHVELHPDDARALYLGAGALVELREEEKALQWANRALSMDPNDAGLVYGMACIFARLGRIDEAVAHLTKAIDCGFNHRQWIEKDADLEAIRTDKRFAEQLSRLGEQEAGEQDAGE